MSPLLTTRERALLVALLLVLGLGVLWLVVQNAPPVSGSIGSGGAATPDPSIAPESRIAELPALPGFPLARSTVLLVPAAGQGAADLVLGADGSWRSPTWASQPASAPAVASRPVVAAPLVICLPGPLAGLDPRARASLVHCLEVARRTVPGGDRVLLPADAPASERAELDLLRRWLR